MKSEYSLSELAALVAAQLIGDGDTKVCGVNTLDDATSTDVSFLANPLYTEAMKQSKAGAVCVGPDAPRLGAKNFLVSQNPSATFQKIAELLLAHTATTSAFSGIHPTAIIHPSVKLGSGVSIGPYAVIDQGVEIGQETQIGPHTTIGYGVRIGAQCTLHPHVVIRERCILGSRVIVQPGAVIGACGFGYTQDAQGRHTKLQQLGTVVIEDDVEIGANTTIDRARFKETVLRRGSKIDNLCQIAHNVEIGEHNILAAQTGIAGSSKTGKHVMLGGQVGVLGHVELEDQVLVGTRGGVSKSLKKGKYRGSPAIPIAEYNRQEVHVRKLEEYVQRLKALEKKFGNGI